MCCVFTPNQAVYATDCSTDLLTKRWPRSKQLCLALIDQHLNELKFLHSTGSECAQFLNPHTMLGLCGVCTEKKLLWVHSL
jgi:hypothetical protein